MTWRLFHALWGIRTPSSLQGPRSWGSSGSFLGNPHIWGPGQVSIAAGPCLELLACWWANLGTDPSNGLCRAPGAICGTHYSPPACTSSLAPSDTGYTCPHQVVRIRGLVRRLCSQFRRGGGWDLGECSGHICTGSGHE